MSKIVFDYGVGNGQMGVILCINNAVPIMGGSHILKRQKANLEVF